MAGPVGPGGGGPTVIGAGCGGGGATIGAGPGGAIEAGPIGGRDGTVETAFGFIVALLAASSPGSGADMGRSRWARAAERASSSGESLCFTQPNTEKRSSLASADAVRSATPRTLTISHRDTSRRWEGKKFCGVSGSSIMTVEETDGRDLKFITFLKILQTLSSSGMNRSGQVAAMLLPLSMSSRAKPGDLTSLLNAVALL